MKPERWDVYLQFAAQLSWTPSQVDSLDPDFVTEQLIFWRAERDAQRMNAADRNG